MFTFLKANIASLLASIIDYALTLFLAKYFDVDPVIATVTGAFFGGLINFFIGRGWVFRSTERKAGHQGLRYLLVWAGSLLLNAAGIALIVKMAGMPIAAGKVVVSLLVAVAYNYPLQKRYVFYNN